MLEIIEIDKNTWRIEDEFVRFFLLEGKDSAALIDTGFSNTNVKQTVESLTDLPIVLINTHGDGDHVSATGDYKSVRMTKEDYINCGVCDRFPNTKFIELNDRDVIDLGDRTLEIITIPGHTKGSIAILDIEKRYLFSGDTVQSGHIYMFGPHRDPNSFEQSLTKLINESSRYDKIIASHDEPILEADYAQKVLMSWKDANSQNVLPNMIELHGMKVNSYDCTYCGFFM